MPGYRTLSVIVHDNDIATLNIARPSKSNAVDLDMWDELPLALEYLDQRDDVRVVGFLSVHTDHHDVPVFPYHHHDECRCEVLKSSTWHADTPLRAGKEFLFRHRLLCSQQHLEHCQCAMPWKGQGSPQKAHYAMAGMCGASADCWPSLMVHILTLSPLKLPSGDLQDL